MTTTATHNEHDPTPERVLFVAFALREKTWQLGCTTGHGQKPRERTVAARHQARVRQAVAQATRRCGLPESAPGVSGDAAGRDGCWRHRLLTSHGRTNQGGIPPRLRSIVASVGSAQSGSASGAESGCGRGAGGGGPFNVRARQKSRRRDGVASDRPASCCRQTPRASGDGPESSHGEKGVGDHQSHPHRKSPDRPGHEAQHPKNGGRKTYARGT